MKTKKPYTSPTADVTEVKYQGVLCGSGVLGNYSPTPWGESVSSEEDAFSLFENNRLL